MLLGLWENRHLSSKNLNVWISWVNGRKRPCYFIRLEFQPKVAGRSFRNYPLSSKYPFDSLPFQKIHCWFLPFKGTLSFLTWSILYIENIISEFLVRSHMSLRGIFHFIPHLLVGSSGLIFWGTTIPFISRVMDRRFRTLWW